MSIITLSAKARCGKDTAAQYLTTTIPNSVSYALATCFKERMAVHFNEYFDYDDVFGFGVDRNTFMIYIDRPVLIDCIISVFDDFGYTLTHDNIDWSIIDDRNGWTIRQLMQLIGTDIGVNQIDTRIWLEQFSKWMFNSGSKYDTVVITDCRQVHEIEYLREIGSQVIHIYRTTGLHDTHVTEQGLDVELGDRVIHNDGTLDEFYKKLDDVIASK